MRRPRPLQRLLPTLVMASARRRLLLATSLLALTWAATGPAHAQEKDPLEPLNRAVFTFNRGFDTMLLKPASIAYRNVVPQRGRNGIRNFLDNLRSPVLFVNDLLQGERERAGITLSRFVVNSVIGLGGVFDVATEAGFNRHYEDFGQTLGVWGVPAGPYLMLPLFGPSSLRDAGGLAVDNLVLDPFGTLNPVGYSLDTSLAVGRAGTDAVDLRDRYGSSLDDIYKNSLDPYVSFRTIYMQRRAAEIRNQAADAQSQQNYDAIFNEETNP